VLEWLDNHVAHDQVQGDHRHEHGKIATAIRIARELLIALAVSA